MSNRKLIKSTSIIGSATTASRILGFIRDIMLARFFGTNIFAQAFVVAFRLPNMLRDMVGEGATDAAIVPILTEYRHTRPEKEYWEAARVILNLMLMVLITLSVLGVLFSPVLVRLIAPGFVVTPEKFRITVDLTRWLFPYILFLGLVAYCKGVLSSFNYFTTPAFSPVILNMAMITSLVFLCPVYGVKGIVAGVLGGGVLEVLIQVPPLVKRGFRLEGVFRIAHPIASRIGKLLLPRALGTAVYQMSVFVDTILASLSSVVGAGGVAALYYSNRLVQLPLAVFGISLATAVLPRLSREAATRDMNAFRDTVAFSLRTVFTIMMPAIFGLMILAEPMMRILFQRGEFTAYSTGITSAALFYYSFGLFAYAGIKILVSAYYSMGDTKTPVKTASVSLLVNIVLNLILMWPLKIGGLALATSIAAITNFIILYILLARRIGDPGTKGLALATMKMLLAAGVMSVFTCYMKARFLQGGAGGSLIKSIVTLVGTVIASGGVYVVSAYFIGVPGVRRITGLLRDRMPSS
ncbi:MAG: murein biosynthesis integral membrane protein MurJ [Candidatus Omnitrophica bacterium]|nr:murein biosynthesis integral membrane protein MurJ [Candidatus Omnitrophota bacterium]MDD5488444.1 murein biosynthesis integral membrane protein MurJ [Candidatus Omnitrophota bacterium]